MVFFCCEKDEHTRDPPVREIPIAENINDRGGGVKVKVPDSVVSSLHTTDENAVAWLRKRQVEKKDSSPRSETKSTGEKKNSRHPSVQQRAIVEQEDSVVEEEVQYHHDQEAQELARELAREAKVKQVEHEQRMRQHEMEEARRQADEERKRLRQQHHLRAVATVATVQEQPPSNETQTIEAMNQEISLNSSSNSQSQSIAASSEGSRTNLAKRGVDMYVEFDRKSEDDNMTHSTITESVDRLSGLASDADTQTRERCILACRLLKVRLAQKDPPPIMPMERELLRHLLQRFASSEEPGSEVAFQALSSLLNDDQSRSTASSSSHFGKGLRTIATSTTIREEDSSSYMSGLETNYTSHRYDGASQDQHEDVDRDDDQDKNKELKRYDGWTRHQDGQRTQTRGDELVFAPSPMHPFWILGLDKSTPSSSRVLTPSLMEILVQFLPVGLTADNFWLKFSLVRDGASLTSLLEKVNTSKHTLLAVETTDGSVFGCFCSSRWGIHPSWFGSGDSFLWSLKNSRYKISSEASTETDASRAQRKMEVYPFTGNDNMVQYCTSQTIAVGGGNWSAVKGRSNSSVNGIECPYPNEPIGIGFLLDGDLEGGETNSCSTFANPRLCGRNTNRNEFRIRNLEAWTLTPSSSVAEAQALERQKLIWETQHVSQQ